MTPLKKTMQLFHSDQKLTDLFAFNEFSEEVEFLRAPEWDYSVFKGKSLDDQDLIQIKYYISRVHSFEPHKNILGEACFLLGKRKSYHPVKKFIETEKWDDEPRVDKWLINSIKCLDNEYTRAAASKFLIAAVSRIYNPGCKFDYMLIIEGRQGIGKSTLVEKLSKEWYLDTNFGHKDKDLIDSMRGAFIIEISELSGMNKKDVDWLKSFLSKKVDRVRLAYAARSKDFRRKCVFMGTYNPSGNNMYLRDDTGNRRFWPVECGDNLDIEYIRNNCGQLWAEALVRYKSGEKLYIDNQHALEILSGIHKARELESPTFHEIRDWLKFRKMSEVTMQEIIGDCLKVNMNGKMPRDMLSLSTTIGIIMRKLSWTKGTNENSNRYYEPQLNFEEDLNDKN